MVLKRTTLVVYLSALDETDHGFDPDLPSMAGLFAAAGPGIKKGVKLDQAGLVDVHRATAKSGETVLKWRHVTCFRLISCYGSKVAWKTGTCPHFASPFRLPFSPPLFASKDTFSKPDFAVALSMSTRPCAGCWGLSPSRYRREAARRYPRGHRRPLRA